MRIFTIVSIAFTLATACASPFKPSPNNCQEVRAAFDIGSGSTKVLVAKIDVCKELLVEKLWETSTAVPYQESIDASGSFDEHIQQKGKQIFLHLLNEAKSRGSLRAGGVATHAFRESRNGQAFLSALEASGHNIIPTKLEVISQDQELLLGYTAAVKAAQAQTPNVVVWDIGGGSQQMAVRDANAAASLLKFKGQMASTRFMQTFALHRIPDQRQSPNPIGSEGAKKGLERAKRSARESVPDEMRSLINAGAEIIGIGGVLAKSVQPQIGKNPFAAEDVAAAIDAKVPFSDTQIGGDYANTQVTNLILVLGYMHELGIQKVRTVDTGLVVGVALDPQFWSP